MDLRTTRTIRSAIEIRAPLDLAWHVLSDFPAYRDWNPHIRQVRGRPGEGRRLLVLSQPDGARPLVLRPKLVVWRPPEEFRWRATFLHGRLFSGEHGFRLERLDQGRVRFVHDETFRGLLVPLYALLRMPATRRGFAEMNEALRDRAEALVLAMGSAAAEGYVAAESDRSQAQEPAEEKQTHAVRLRRRGRKRSAGVAVEEDEDADGAAAGA